MNSPHQGKTWLVRYFLEEAKRRNLSIGNGPTSQYSALKLVLVVVGEGDSLEKKPYMAFSTVLSSLLNLYAFRNSSKREVCPPHPTNTHTHTIENFVKEYY